MEDILKKALQKIKDNNIENNSKSLMNNAKSVLTECEKCKKLKEEIEDLKYYENILNNLCDIIDPKNKIENYEDIENELKKIIEQNNLLIEYYEKSKKFIEQQKKGRPAINIDINKINYLRNIENMSYKEIAKKIGVSESTIIRRYKKQ